MKTSQITVVLTGGGSGGHITPLLSVARALRRQAPGSRLVYIGLKGEAVAGLSEQYDVFDDVYYVTSGKFRRYHGEGLLRHLLDIKTILLNVRDAFKVLIGAVSAWRLLGRIKPDVVFSKGGYVVVPVGLAASWRRRKIVTHDSDAVPGLANRLVGRWAVVHATGFPAHNYRYPAETIKYVGVPTDEKLSFVTRQAQATAKKKLSIPIETKVILLSGGGHGAARLNKYMITLAPRLLSTEANLTLIHFTGLAHKEIVQEDYRQALSSEQMKHVQVIGFSDRFNDYTAAADIVVGRAGASTLAELAIQGKASIIIPAAQLSGGHQLLNADELTTHRAALVLHSNCSADDLFDALSKLLSNPKLSAELSANIAKMARPKAADDLAEIILDCARNP